MSFQPCADCGETAIGGRNRCEECRMRDMIVQLELERNFLFDRMELIAEVSFRGTLLAESMESAMKEVLRLAREALGRKS